MIRAYDNISPIMIYMGAMAGYLQLEMLLGALPRIIIAKVVINIDRDPRDPLTSKYHTLRKHDPKTCLSANTVALLYSEGAHMAPGVCPYSLPAGVPLPQMPVELHVLAFASE